MKYTLSIIFCLKFIFILAQVQLNSDSSVAKILSGQHEVSLILDFYRCNKSVSDDSLFTLLKISDKNYHQNEKKLLTDPDFQLRHITFSDQLFRTKCYVHKLIDYSVVQKNDIVLQNSFLAILQMYPNLDLLTNSTFQTTFDLLLIHSVTTLESKFFVNNFKTFSIAFSNNFRDFHNLKNIVDMYLKFKYDKQFFGTDSGKGKLPAGSFGLLPKMTGLEFQAVLKELGIEHPIL